MRTRALMLLAAAAGAGALAVALYAVDPSQSGVILCPYRLLTGWACPGCGLTRATHHLLHADVALALAYNPLLFAAVPLALGFVAAPRLPLDGNAARVRTWIGWIGLALTLVFWVWRNTAAYPYLHL